MTGEATCQDPTKPAAAAADAPAVRAGSPRYIDFDVGGEAVRDRGFKLDRFLDGGQEHLDVDVFHVLQDHGQIAPERAAAAGRASRPCRGVVESAA